MALALALRSLQAASLQLVAPVAATCAPSSLLPAAAAACGWQRALASSATSVTSTSDHLDLPGGQRVPLTPALSFVGGPSSTQEKVPCYRTIDTSGRDVPGEGGEGRGHSRAHANKGCLKRGGRWCYPFSLLSCGMQGAVGMAGWTPDCVC